MSDDTSALRAGREAYTRRDWSVAYTQLSIADRHQPLGGTDLERLAVAAYLIGEDDAATEFWTRAVNQWGRSSDPVSAARCAFWLGLALSLRGEQVRGGGWLGRAQKLLDTTGVDCPERGYLLVPLGLQRLAEGDGTAARDVFSTAAVIGERFADPDLISLGALGTGHALIVLGRHPDGVAAFDEAMIRVTSEEVSPIVTGIVYCAVIEQCQRIFDLRRSQEWTAALTRWCSAQPDLVPYRGQCLVHRAEILLLQGAWAESMEAARRAHRRLTQPTVHAAVGSASYLMAELHRLRGEFAQAEKLYKEANKWGRPPRPGLALLRMRQGRVGSAVACIRREVDETLDPLEQARLLPACVEIMLAAHDVPSARAAAAALDTLAARLDIPYLHAVAAQASGSVLLGESRAQNAVAVLREAWERWNLIGAPYEAARVRELIGRACRELGDVDTARMEFDLAAAIYRDLAAAPDLERVRTEVGTESSASPLTPRELNVLRLVAAGKTNRAVAADLFLSEKTVARHMSNIFLKLGISSRSAATAYAYEHRLVEPSA
ncbi:MULTISPECIES: LuxR C-terminal-related transcriptional regulator [Rhodococcus]|uniref:LuxR C-terminal-related transcriptional regulator n=1 Tax=Rhodococcus oxybenzonivorans TaxID=1990687 RepID=A0AAE5A7H4_9NOCA|nr:MULTISPECIES: LuxR C-terminal-related transcriptional regulator [Rhodococcus]MDV7241268.1 LuxR C-terminal-related transcriptional regulator [Rhodococcus oxybenzonivorans]MDV7266183.1 LuxR C-terminal-related transcriptional regulator [Rhodococcus oxybenzonivorans]MDV7273541.1 LuxR C-terminal-related transcriptional regulator [Rhodococcus oxybenzonivorans]MDV7332721.1 LuxR C-terminal-related transcriptional regulator [Rhodococcus oxybenzonivorans]MDV7341887.1 LuxR C-terminal-related transcrip